MERQTGSGLYLNVFRRHAQSPAGHRTPHSAKGSLRIDILRDSPTTRRSTRSQVGETFPICKSGPGDGAGDAAGEGIAAAVEDFGMGERGARDLLKEGQPARPVGGDCGAGFDFDTREVRVVAGEEIPLVSGMVAPEKQARAPGPVGPRLDTRRRNSLAR